jgi:hypothetical protein
MKKILLFLVIFASIQGFFAQKKISTQYDHAAFYGRFSLAVSNTE